MLSYEQQHVNSIEKSEHPITERISLLEYFIETTLLKIIEYVESSSQHGNVKEQLCCQLLEAQQQKTGVPNDMTAGDHEETPKVPNGDTPVIDSSPGGSIMQPPSTSATPVGSVRSDVSLKRELELALSASSSFVLGKDDARGSFHFPGSVVAVDTRIVKEIDFDGPSRDDGEAYDALWY